MLDNLKGAMGLWSIVRGTTSSDLEKQMQTPVSLAIVGATEAANIVWDRLGQPPHERFESFDQLRESDLQLVVDAQELASLPENDFNAALSKLLTAHKEQRIALAYQYPVLRQLVVNQLSHERAIENAKIAAISALPGVIPLADWLLPATAAGDLLLLTRNQVTLLLEVAACFGRPPRPMARVKELLPVVGSAFGWRAFARELIGIVPGGVGVAVKAAVAYAGTYSVGRAAAFYYSGASVAMSTEKMHSIYKTALDDGASKTRALIETTFKKK